MRRAVSTLLLILALSACHRRPDWMGGDGGKDVHMTLDGNAMGDTVSLNLPGVNAEIALPRLDLGKHVDLDGIKLAPGTKLSAIDVHDAKDVEGDRVRLRFENPMSPLALGAYYRDQAARAGFSDIALRNGTMTARKKHKRFALDATSAGAGSTGTILITGAD